MNTQVVNPLEDMQVNSQELGELICAFAPKKYPLIVTGMPGVGKTDSAHQAAGKMSWDIVVTHPSVEEPTDRKGVPFADIQSASCLWLTDEVTKQLCFTTRPTLWLIDDLAQGAPAVQAVHMQWLLNRGVAGHKLSDYVSIVCCTNDRRHGAGASGLLEPVKSRAYTIVELIADIESWSIWAYGAGIDPVLIAFLRWRPELLCKFKPVPDLVNQPLPRTWAHVDAILKLGLSEKVMRAAIAGAVGSAAATEFLAFVHTYRNLVSLDDILKNPLKAAIPDQPDQLYATAVGLANRADVKNYANILTFAERLFDAGYGEHATLIVRDAEQQNPAFLSGPNFQRAHTGKLAPLFH